ncbi:MAG TPA: DNA glycosylase [Candidatus Thermoplasmatota archaeon]|nr:DNA glycosylase [Candidatus Thermoplasmatota archaeon]
MHLRPRGGFDATATLLGGQSFRWRRFETGHVRGVALGRAWHIVGDGADLHVDVDLAPAAVRRYLGLDPQYPSAVARLARDPALAPAVAAHPGLRVLRQDPWEALAAFIVSANNNVPRIEGIVERLSVEAGGVIGADAPPGNAASGARVRARVPAGEGAHVRTRAPAGERARVRARAPLHAFPTPDAVARLDERVLRRVGLGYRAPFLREAARIVADGLDLAALARRPYRRAHDALTELPGVGPKVADCVCLFGLGHGEAFPVDTWMRDAMARVLARPLGDRDAGDAARRRWGANAGLAQQFLFHAARVRGKPGRAAPGSARFRTREKFG